MNWSDLLRIYFISKNIYVIRMYCYILCCTLHVIWKFWIHFYVYWFMLVQILLQKSNPWCLGFFSPLWFLCKTSTWTNLILKGCGSSRVNPLTELLVLIVVFPLQIFSPWILNQYKTALSWTQVLMFQLNLCLSLCLFRMWNMQMAPGLKILARADKEQHLYILQY